MAALIRAEKWQAISVEAEALGRKHFEECDGGIDLKRPYCLDDAVMGQISDLGALHITTARIDGHLVGYCMWNIGPDVESKGLLIAQHGPWYVAPEQRGTRVGLQLFMASLDYIKALGVKNAFPHHRLEGAGKGLGKFYARLGAKEIQHTYSLWIGD